MSINTRIQMKRDTTANWDSAVGFVPLAGEIIVYTDYRQETTIENGQSVTKNVAGIKIGDGNAYVQDLPFQSGVTEKDIAFWSNKLNYDSTLEVNSQLVNETLVFNRN